MYVVLSVACCVVLANGCYQDSPQPSLRETTQLLIVLLNDPDGLVRRTAAEALGKIGDREAVPVLIQSLRDQEALVRGAAAHSLKLLAPLEDASVAGLLGSIRDPDATVRRSAVQALGAAENVPALVPRLAELAGHAESAVRLAAVQALLLAGGADALRALIALATDKDPEIRRTAVAALGESGDRRALPVLRDRLLRDSASEVRAEAAYRLKWAGDQSVLADLASMASADSSSAVRRWARQTEEELRRGASQVRRLNRSP